MAEICDLALLANNQIVRNHSQSAHRIYFQGLT
jgi:hypothetical protein